MTDPINHGLIKRRYLGDGVYASFDGFHIWLYTQEGNKIALEPVVYNALTTYHTDVLAAIEAYKERKAENGTN